METETVVRANMHSLMQHVEFTHAICKGTKFDREDISKALNTLLYGAEVITKAMEAIIFEESSDS
jgi:hypothetical protein